MKRLLILLTGMTVCVIILGTEFLTPDKGRITGDVHISARTDNSPQTDYSDVYDTNMMTSFENHRPTLPLSPVCNTNLKKKNVLFLIVDDLVGDLPLRKDGEPLMSNGQRLHIPNLRQLAESSLVFQAAYNQYPLCNPSRSSMLTGRRPDTTRLFGLKESFRTRGGNFTTIPEYFKRNGYHTAGIGKVFHFCLGAPLHLRRDPQSWSAIVEAGQKWDTYWRKNLGGGWKGIPKERQLQNPLPDKMNTDKAIEVLRGHARQCSSFFLAVGFHQPHEPIVYPEELASHYPLHLIKLPLILQHDHNLSSFTLDNQHTLAFQTANNVIENQRLKSDGSNWQDLLIRRRQAYFSAVTYLDQLVGQLLGVLDDIGLAKNTIVTLVADHGVKMGEHGAWGKNALFDADTHVPWILRIPGVTDSGIQIQNPVELVDLFPTLVAASGLPPIPECPDRSNKVKTCHEGMNLLSVIKEGKLSRKRPAYSQVWRRDGMGLSIRTSDFRYTEYVTYDYYRQKPIWNVSYNTELYDYREKLGEAVNRINDPRYQTVKRALQSILHAGWRNESSTIQIPLPKHTQIPHRNTTQFQKNGVSNKTLQNQIILRPNVTQVSDARLNSTAKETLVDKTTPIVQNPNDNSLYQHTNIYVASRKKHALAASKMDSSSNILAVPEEDTSSTEQKNTDRIDQSFDVGESKSVMALSKAFIAMSATTTTEGVNDEFTSKVKELQDKVTAAPNVLASTP